jgi:UDP-N-acetylmuramate dehydrogenase
MNAFEGELLSNVSLDAYTTWRVGGVAAQLYKPKNLQDLSCFLKHLSKEHHPFFLGLGSNLLVRDGGLKETVILTQAGLTELATMSDDSFRAESGVTCAKVARFCVKNNFAQAEFFAGIPGTIGGALAMNAGAFGGETWDYVVAVETIDREGNIHLRAPSEYHISYRTVIGPEEWFVAGHFKLPKGDGEQTQKNIKALLKLRNEKQPIGLPSCGSVFKNPEGDHAGRLIEACGLKGYCIGGAGVSEKHANFIINTGDATAQDIEALVAYIQKTVKEKTGVELHPEFRVVGELS